MIETLIVSNICTCYEFKFQIILCWLCPRMHTVVPTRTAKKCHITLINRDAEKICGDLEGSYFGDHRGNQPAPEKKYICCRRYLLCHNKITPQINAATMFKETPQIFSATEKICLFLPSKKSALNVNGPSDND